MELLTGEPLAVDLLNTRAQTAGGAVDALDSAVEFDVWLAAQRERMTSSYATLTQEDRDAVRALREHIRATVDAVRHGVAPDEDALDALTAASRAAPSYLNVTLEDGKPAAARRREGKEIALLLAELGEAAVELITSPDVRKLRECEGPQCSMLFMPAHPRRRWCSPALCGNRVRVARYYQRHKTFGRPAG